MLLLPLLQRLTKFTLTRLAIPPTRIVTTHGEDSLSLQQSVDEVTRQTSPVETQVIKRTPRSPRAAVATETTAMREALSARREKARSELCRQLVPLSATSVQANSLNHQRSLERHFMHFQRNFISLFYLLLCTIDFTIILAANSKAMKKLPNATDPTWYFNRFEIDWLIGLCARSGEERYQMQAVDVRMNSPEAERKKKSQMVRKTLKQMRIVTKGVWLTQARGVQRVKSKVPREKIQTKKVRNKLTIKSWNKVQRRGKSHSDFTYLSRSPTALVTFTAHCTALYLQTSSKSSTPAQTSRQTPRESAAEQLLMKAMLVLMSQDLKMRKAPQEIRKLQTVMMESQIMIPAMYFSTSMYTRPRNIEVTAPPRMAPHPTQMSPNACPSKLTPFTETDCTSIWLGRHMSPAKLVDWQTTPFVQREGNTTGILQTGLGFGTMAPVGQYLLGKHETVYEIEDGHAAAQTT